MSGEGEIDPNLAEWLRGAGLPENEPEHQDPATEDIPAHNIQSDVEAVRSVYNDDENGAPNESDEARANDALGLDDLSAYHELVHDKKSPFEGEGSRTDAPQPDTDNSGKEVKIDEVKRGKIIELVENAIDDFNRGVGETGNIKGIKVNHWQMGMKNGFGDFEAHDLHAASFIVDAESLGVRSDPEWPVVQPATLKLEPVPKKTGRSIDDDTRLRKAFIVPDTQIPYHDPNAMAVALQIATDQEPDLVVFLGDYLDWPEQSKYPSMPEYARISQLGINIGGRVLELFRQRLPDAEMVVIEGNHDLRIWNDLIANSMGSFNLKQANATPEEWPVMSVPHFLKMNDLGVGYIDGYPNNEFWINPNLVCIHGVKSVSRGSTARAIWNERSVSSIFGHIHKIEQLFEDDEDFYGPVRKFTYTPGGLCLTDGRVPNSRAGRDLRTGQIIRKQQRWQQGVARVLYEPFPKNGKPDRNKIYKHYLDSYDISTNDGYATLVGDEFYKPNKKLVRQLDPASFEASKGTIFDLSSGSLQSTKRRAATA